ncbi:hydroxyethylthiazole kinase [Zhouia sp. PK063]|uniref:hydroxyethylthiazole kinase n=1 Tax=Zhouia sp. PK063 TaxID=3373602 RepID=UPI0037906318
MNTTINAKLISDHLQQLRSTAPLVHNITNYVVMNTTANALLSIGASPVMAHAVEEMENMVAIAGALVINIGTLNTPWVEGMLTAGKAAHKKGIPIVLDPVGAGATQYRTETCWKIINQCKPTIIRGNSSEIMALLHADIQTKGVDSTTTSEDALGAAQQLAKETHAVIVISGATDYITDGVHTITIKNGHELMPKVTGLGCTASAICGAFAASNNNVLNACAAAMAVMGIAGEVAAQKSNGPGSLQMNFLDTLYLLDTVTINKHYKV